ncbi:collectin-12-like [Saccostrea echinata]|uniref:collectin-12-like n=1 Tax=Saccostrea echinata TaxID=191078 RepID=UPI002A814AFD|nr:collectin-12-like [Saccostrea echinata]
MYKTDSLIECALSCKAGCVCFGFHLGQNLCRRQTQCESSRMNQTEIGWIYYLPDRDCNIGWNCNNDTGRCYSLNSTKVTQADAMQSCCRCNSYLVEINDLDENTWITTNILNVVFCSSPYNCATWTGGNDKATEGVYVWEHSNTTIGFTKWSKRNPDNYLVPEREVDCIDILYNGEWNDRPCSYLNGFLCEREGM